MNLNLAVCYTDIHSKKKTLRICTATLITSLNQENLNLSPMAKSIRSKAKRSFRSKKRETGVYAATEAARLHRLNSKLTSVVSTDKDERISAEDKEEGVDEMPDIGDHIETNELEESMVVDTEKANRISTHGPRHSRREEWRTSKGMTPRPSRNAMNRQGGVAARRKAGRPKRRR